MLTAGILAALLVRDRIGRGQVVEASMWQGLNPYDYCGTVLYQLAARPSPVEHRGPPVFAANRYVLMGCSRDGRWFSIQTMLPHQVQALARAVEVTDALDEERFAHTPRFATPEDADAWEQLLWERMRSYDGDELTKRFLAEPDVPFEVIGTTEAAFDHPGLVRGTHMITLDDPVHGPMEQVGPVARLHETPSRIERPAPAVGEGDQDAPPAARPLAAPSSGPAPAHPLDGITIVELGYFYAMPNAAAMAAALGARVIKLEEERGDPMREMTVPRESAYAKVMEGKESLAVDLSSRRGQQVAHDLLRQADVFVVSFRPGVAERLHLGYEELHRINPNLVYVHACGYGAESPWAARPMYAVTATALAGSWHRHAGYWLRPEMTDGLDVAELRAILAPRLSSRAEGDSNGSLVFLTTILLGLTARARHGGGQLATSSLATANLYSLADDFTRFEGKVPLVQADPEFYGHHALYRLYPARTGWVFLAAPTGTEWRALIDILGRPELAADPRFADRAARAAHDDELAAVVADVLRSRSAAEWERTLSAADVGCAEVFEGTVSEFTATERRLLESGLTFEVDDPTFGRVIRHGVPATFSATPGRVAPSCLAGQDTDRILAGLGYSPEQITDLRADRVVFGPE
jgi:crotonobetainyl-CoA:carnitine CoA-transferase CaiB-like acyl-CoA transferase